ncbi:MAG TPA: protein TolR [Gammaproteobacteria bacterium]|jgi:biopolymer transport protein TolR|nr:protein TolR [Gammaproteobacteria bacterium]HIK72076.1 protein TolR [Gammaproteobacteria bacterium]
MLKRRRNLISDINVVPYIDVMLVLLVIFMVAAPLMVQGISINLPEVSSDALPVEKSEPLIISIRSDGSFFLEIDATRNKSLNLEEISQEIAKILKANKDMQVVIRGDGEVKYESVMLLMSQLQQLGSKNIGLITKPPKTN